MHCEQWLQCFCEKNRPRSARAVHAGLSWLHVKYMFSVSRLVDCYTLCTWTSLIHISIISCLFSRTAEVHHINMAFFMTLWIGNGAVLKNSSP